MCTLFSTNKEYRTENKVNLKMFAREKKMYFGAQEQKQKDEKRKRFTGIKFRRAVDGVVNYSIAIISKHLSANIFLQCFLLGAKNRAFSAMFGVSSCK